MRQCNRAAGGAVDRRYTILAYRCSNRVVHANEKLDETRAISHSKKLIRLGKHKENKENHAFFRKLLRLVFPNHGNIKIFFVFFIF